MFMMGFGHLRRRGTGGTAPAVMGVTHPSHSPLSVSDLEKTGGEAAPGANLGGPQIALPVSTEDGPKRPHRELIRDGVFYLSEGEMAADEASAGSPRQPLGQPAPMGWIRALHQWRDDNGLARTGMRCVAWNIDSLYLCVYAKLAPNILERLLDLFEMARNRDPSDPVFVASGGRQWKVTWASAHYALRLDIPSVASISIAKRTGPHSPAVYVELRAEALWQYGADRLAAELEQMIRSWEVVRPEPTRVEVSRIDLAADFVGFSLDGTELPHRRWVTNSLSRAMYFKSARGGRGTIKDPLWNPSTDQNKAARKRQLELFEQDRKRQAKAHIRQREQWEAERNCAVFYRGQIYTGGAFGTGDVRVRHYRKDIEIKAKGGKGAWLKRFWSAGGWTKGQAVMRVEAQLRGPALKAMIGVSGKDSAVGRGGRKRRSAGTWNGGDVTKGNSWRAVRRHLDGIWRYMVGAPEGKGWITLRALGNHSKPDRWPIDPRWVQVQGIEWGAVVDGYGLEHVQVHRLRKNPTAKHKVGPKWNCDPEAGAVTSTDIERVVEQVSGPAAMHEWGDGLPKKSHRMRFGTLCEETYDAAVEVLSAAERRESLRASVNGMLASLGAVLAIEQKRQHDPADHRHVLRWLEEEIDPTDFAKRWSAARQRFALRDVIGYRAGRAHKRGDGRYLPNFAFTEVA
jgi:hypothetical protein